MTRAARSESDLSQFLLRKIGVCFDPRPEVTFKKWLGQIAVRLRQHANEIDGHNAVSEYTRLAKNWVEVTKRVAAGTWGGIVCPKNADADVLIEVRERGSGTGDARFEYWIHCPGCGAEIYFHSKVQYSPTPHSSG